MDTTSQSRADDAFKARVTESQAGLFSFIALMVGNTPDAWDVLQNTNLALMSKSAQYEPERPFSAWARSIAYYEVLTFRQKKRRERLVFDDDMLDQVSARLVREEPDEEASARQSAALAYCLGKLLPSQRALIMQRYQSGVSVIRLAQARACSEASISTLLYRIRKQLAACIKDAVSRETVS